MAKKRANGEGNIRKRKDGRWEGRYTAGYDSKTGKRIIKNVLGKTQAEVKEKLAQAQQETAGLDVARSEDYTSLPAGTTWRTRAPHSSTAAWLRCGMSHSRQSISASTTWTWAYSSIHPCAPIPSPLIWLPWPRPSPPLTGMKFWASCIGPMYLLPAISLSSRRCSPMMKQQPRRALTPTLPPTMKRRLFHFEIHESKSRIR